MFEPSSRPVAPRVSLRQVDGLKRFLALPKHVDGQPADWTTEGLLPSRFPERLLAPTETDEFLTYEIVQEEDYRAIYSRPRPRKDGRVRLADVRIAWRADRHCTGVAAFDLEPGRLSEVRVSMPSRYDLVRLFVAGVPVEPRTASPASAGKHTWRIPLWIHGKTPSRTSRSAPGGNGTAAVEGQPPMDRPTRSSGGLPQRIEILFAGRLPEPASDAAQSFDAPALDGLAVAQTLWTLVGPPASAPAQPEQGNTVGEPAHELARLRSAAAMIESGAALPTVGPRTTSDWYRHWARRLVSARAALRPVEEPDALSQTTWNQELDAIDRQQSEIAERLGVTEVYDRLKRYGPAVADDPAQLWQDSLNAGRPATRHMVFGRSESITLSHRPEPSSGLPHRLPAAVALAGLIFLLWLGSRRGILVEQFVRYPQAFGVAAGLAWWLWLAPSLLGWAIVLASLAALRSGWPHMPPAPESSIIALRTRHD